MESNSRRRCEQVKSLIMGLNMRERELMRALLSAEAESWRGCPMECDLAREGVDAFDGGRYDHPAIARHLTPEIIEKVLSKGR
jgi:hypothetical protein